MATVARLHPGALGSRVGGELAAAGHTVRWLPEGRSDRSRDRAEREGLTGVPDLPSLVDGADVVLSVLPPQAALPVAEQVAASGFAGTYVDANPLSPATLERVRAVVEGAGATLVDGGIVGPPPAEGHRTHLYLAGDHDRVVVVAALLPGPRLLPVVVGQRVGQASAAKQAYALVNKGRMVLAAMAADLADAHGVGDVLAAEHDRADASLLAELPELRQGLAQVGWRWAPEFDELAASLDDVGDDAAAVRGLAARLRALGSAGG